MTSRNVRILAVALALLAGAQAIATGTLTAGLVFAATCVPVAFLFVRALRQIDIAERDERRAGRDLSEDVP